MPFVQNKSGRSDFAVEAGLGWNRLPACEIRHLSGFCAHGNGTNLRLRGA
jgi:hypothetical protein